MNDPDPKTPKNPESRADLLAAARAVPDPELPVLTLGDLGVIRDLRVAGDGAVEVDLTPTYTGCPATAVIADDVRDALYRAGVHQVRVRTVLAPAWTTDWMSETGRRKLREYGIAPPGPAAHADGGPVRLAFSARCPRCGSADTREVSHFGSTPCKALWTCRSCAEPFDSFKAI
ncbi:MAG TPA: 1,2-phenylacetyl-CoA epoxidase subunit PaaD [Streptosporangiaceae bacterium]|nr:1,2-phenylacetyl-CoA epoxidase subunit PaaD [Streptosporangiaceae bacterium]